MVFARHTVVLSSDIMKREACEEDVLKPRGAMPAAKCLRRACSTMDRVSASLDGQLQARAGTMRGELSVRKP